MSQSFVRWQCKQSAMNSYRYAANKRAKGYEQKHSLMKQNPLELSYTLPSITAQQQRLEKGFDFLIKYYSYTYSRMIPMSGYVRFKPPCDCIVQTIIHVFSKISKWLNIFAIFEINIENGLKYVQTSLCFVQWFLR